MKKQDYERIAFAIKSDRIGGGDEGTLSHLAYNLADMFRRNDTKFNWQQFLVDAGIMKEE